MNRFFSRGQKDAPRRAARVGTGSLLVLLLAGLLTDVAPHDEAYASLDYAIALLVLLGATGSAAGFAYGLSQNPAPLPWNAPAPRGLPAPATLTTGARGRGEGWPLLVALLFGPLVVLLSGLGGWV